MSVEPEKSPKDKVSAEQEKLKPAAPKTPAFNDYYRAPNEDDDGYDPYSDRRVEEPLFERDPWN